MAEAPTLPLLCLSNPNNERTQGSQDYPRIHRLSHYILTCPLKQKKSPKSRLKATLCQMKNSLRRNHRKLLT